MTARLDGGPGFRFIADRSWAQLPPGRELEDVAGVAVGPDDRVYVFSRSDHPMMVFARDGAFIESWGAGLFTRPHAVRSLDDGTLLCVDDGDHTVRHCAPDGRVLQTIGTPGRPAIQHSGQPFCRCTDAVRAPDGSFFVSDGYGNARVHRFDRGGRLLHSWGSAGTAPGQFNVPHNLVQDEEGLLYVADRETHRIQVFEPDGTFLRFLGEGLHRPSGLALTRGPRPLMYVAEIGPYLSSNRGWPGLGPRLTVLDLAGNIVSRLAAEPAAGAGDAQFVSPHGIAVDSHGDVYIADVARTGWSSLFPGTALPTGIRGLQKLVRTTDDDNSGLEAA